MGAASFTAVGLERLGATMARHVDEGGVPGLAWLVARDGETHAGSAGTLDGSTPVPRDGIFRIASMTKPVTAVAVLLLVEECVVRLDDELSTWLPELADLEVLADPAGPLDRTVPAHRQPTVHDALTFRLGWGMDFERWGQQPVFDAVTDALGVMPGPPSPLTTPATDDWLAKVAGIPLEHQPGERWLYHLGSELLGMVVERASGRRFDAFLRERVFEPLGMVDTGFVVPEGARDRFGPGYRVGSQDLDDAFDGDFDDPPAFCSGGAGLVSTVDDFAAFASMLLRGGSPLLSRASVAAMTTDQLVAADGSLQVAADVTGAVGWGFGVGVQRRRVGLARSVGSYGWDGGLGTSWANDPGEDLVAVLLTNRCFTGPTLPLEHQDFWTGTYAALV